MADYHFSVTQIKRSIGQSAVACAAYRAGEKFHSDYYGEDSDYTKKKGVITADILLSFYAPKEYYDRETRDALERRGKSIGTMRSRRRILCQRGMGMLPYQAESRTTKKVRLF